MNYRIPVNDLLAPVAPIRAEIDDAIKRVLDSGRYILGPEVEAFEQEVAGYLGCKYAVALNSGTDALVIGLRALGVGPGHEVITSPFTFVATVEAICSVGATPRFVDVREESLDIDHNAISRAFNAKTRAIVPVHLFGIPASMNCIVDMAHRRGIVVLEDAAQAFGSKFLGRSCGTIGDAGALSFFPTKVLGAHGDAGMLVTNDGCTAAVARQLRIHGRRSDGISVMHGCNSRMDELQAAVLRVKLRHLDGWLEQRRQAASFYHGALSKVAGLDGMWSRFSSVTRCWAEYPVFIEPYGMRDRLVLRLAGQGIETAVHYARPVHMMPLYGSRTDQPVFMPEAERAAGRILSLPLWPGITQETQMEVVDALREAMAEEVQ